VSTSLDRRRLLNRALLGALSLFAVALGGGSVAFLWPDVKKGFGSRVDLGLLKDVLWQLKRDGRPIYNQEGRFYLVRYTNEAPDNPYVRAGVVAGGVMAIYQKCSHLGCRVPYCPSSGWFECPCHDSRFNGAGEVMNGPAPAGMWHFPIEITRAGRVIVDTHRPLAQQPAGVDTIGLGPKGDHCVE
jgi:cytochrome b6-f complex iron-sulfur subunit